MTNWLECCVHGDEASCCKNIRGKKECLDACSIYKILFRTDRDRNNAYKHLIFNNVLLSYNYNEEAYLYSEEIQLKFTDDPDNTISMGINQIQIRASLELQDTEKLERALKSDDLQSEIMRSKIKEIQKKWRLKDSISSITIST